MASRPLDSDTRSEEQKRIDDELREHAEQQRLNPTPEMLEARRRQRELHLEDLREQLAQKTDPEEQERLRQRIANYTAQLSDTQKA